MASTSPLEMLSARALPVRLARSVSAATVSVALAVAGHRLGGGGATPGLLAAAVFALVLLVTWRLSTRQLTTGQIVGLLLLAQAAVHGACAVGGEGGGFGATMLVGHVLATALTALLLVRGERWLWTLADRVLLRALAVLLFDFVARCARPTLQRATGFAPLTVGPLSGPGTRGPPIGRA